MSNSPFDAPVQTPAVEIAEDIYGFMHSSTGKHLIKTFTDEYHTLHRKAEQATTMESKAMLVERAAGVKYAIDWFQERKTNYESGYYTKKKR
jgi:hypothetical protein